MGDARYNWVSQHLHSRYLNSTLHTVWLDEDLATFPIWNLSGQLVGYQQYRPLESKKPQNNPKEGRYFTRLEKGKVGVWGLESWKLSNTLFVCEGVFDASKVTWLGFSAVAVLSFDVNPDTASWLSTVSKFRPTVALCDAGVPGLKLAKHTTKHFQLVDYADIGDCPIEYVHDLCSKLNTH